MPRIMVGRRRKKNTYQELDEEAPPPSTRAKGSKKQPQRAGEEQRQQQKRGSNRRKSRRGADGDDEGFRRSLEGDGTKTVVDMSPDGNCLFRALSDQLYWDYGENHEQVRADVCDLLELHEDEFSVFLVLDENEDDEDAADFESYISAMRESGEWGGNLELVAAARLYRRNIKVLSIAAAYTIEHGTKKPSGPDLMVSYHDNDHYNSIRETSGKKPPAPIKIMPTPPSPIKQASSTDAVMQSTENDSVEIQLPSDPRIEQPEKKETENVVKTILKPRKKSGPCPCGSGKTYRRCCKEKEKRTTVRHKVRPEEITNEPPQAHEMENGFRVLKI